MSKNTKVSDAKLKDTKVKNEKVKGYIFAIVAMTAYASSPTILKLAYATGLTTNTLLFNRFLIAFLLGLFLALFRKFEIRLEFRLAATLLGIGLIASFANIGFNMAFRYLEGIIATTISIAYALFVIIIEILLKRTKITKYKILALVLSTLGLILMTVTGTFTVTKGTALLVGLGASIMFAIQTTSINARSIKKIPSEVIYIYTSFPIVLITCIRAMSTGEPLIILEGNQFIFVFILSFFNIFIGRLCFFKAVRAIGATNASLIDMLEPFVSALIAFLLLSEKFSLGILISTVMIVGAILMSSIENTRTAKSNQQH